MPRRLDFAPNLSTYKAKKTGMDRFMCFKGPQSKLHVKLWHVLDLNDQENSKTADGTSTMSPQEKI
jgi:hypothetical protein